MRALPLCLLLLACEEAPRSAQASAPDLGGSFRALDRGAPDAEVDMTREAPRPTWDAAPDARPVDMLVRDRGPRADARAIIFDAGTADVVVPPEPDAAPLPDLGAIPDAGPREHCFDEVDNDDDGRVDCADPDCRRAAACFFAPEDCHNGVDDNGDDWTDCDDVFCLEEPGCALPPEVEPLSTVEIQQVMNVRCGPCHTEERRALLSLANPFTDDTVGVASGQIEMLRIAPGDRANSYLFHKIAHSMHDVFGGGDGMPPDRPLDATTVERIGRWIDALPP